MDDKKEQQNPKASRTLKTLWRLLSGYYVIILIGIFCIALLFTIMILI